MTADELPTADFPATLPMQSVDRPRLQPESLPGFDLHDELGRGGNGVVYRATQRGTGREVALKLLLGGMHLSERQRRRFEREVDLASLLDHPNVVRVYDGGVTSGGLPFLAMELVPGEPLDIYLASRETLSLEDVVRLFVRVARAVEYAHRRGVIHRDLKPGNVFVDAAGEPKLLDFGLAKTAGDDATVTQTGDFLGTPAYAAPEQMVGDSAEIDTRCDLFAIGAMLYEAIAGKPFRPRNLNFSKLLQLAATAEAPPLRGHDAPTGMRYRIDDRLEAVVRKALAREPAQRYQSAAALADDLEHYLAGEPVSARPPGLWFLIQRWFRLYMRASLWSVVVGAVCGGGAAISATLIFWGMNVFSHLDTTYKKFPSLPAPLLSDVILPIIRLCNSVGPAVEMAVGVALLLAAGPLTYTLARPRTMTGAAAAGTAAGLTGGLAATVCGIGWLTFLLLVVTPGYDDIVLLGFGTTRTTLADDEESSVDLLRRYPDLAALPEEERAQALFDKVVDDQVIRAFWAAVLGLAVPMGLLTPGIAGCTLCWASLLRRGDSVWRTLLVYSEIVLPTCVALYMIPEFILHADRATFLLLAVPVPYAAFAWRAWYYGVPWYRRQVFLFATPWLIALLTGEPLPGMFWLSTVAAGLAMVQVAHWWNGRGDPGWTIPLAAFLAPALDGVRHSGDFGPDGTGLGVAFASTILAGLWFTPVGRAFQYGRKF